MKNLFPVLALVPALAVGDIIPVEVALEVVEGETGRSLGVTGNTRSCAEPGDGVTTADIERDACIDLPTHPFDRYDITFALDAPACAKGQSGYTLTDVQLARERDRYRRPIQYWARLDITDRFQFPLLASGEFPAIDRQQTTLRDMNRYRYVLHYRVRGRDCGSGEIITADGVIRHGGRR